MRKKVSLRRVKEAADPLKEAADPLTKIRLRSHPRSPQKRQALLSTRPKCEAC